MECLYVSFYSKQIKSFLSGKLSQPVQAVPAPQSAPAPQPVPVSQPPVSAPAPAAVQDAPGAPVSAAAQSPVAESQPRERRTRAARSTVALSMKAMMEEAPAVDTASEHQAPIPSDEVLKAKWPELADCYQDKPRLASMLKSTTLDIEETEDAKMVIFRVVNDAQKEWVESKLLHELEGKYRSIVGSMKVYLRVAVTPDDAPEQKKIYMPSEQAKELMAQNEEVKSLVKDLELDIK